MVGDDEFIVSDGVVELLNVVVRLDRYVAIEGFGDGLQKLKSSSRRWSIVTHEDRPSRFSL